MTWALLVAVGMGVVYGLHRLALRADERGWIFYKTKPRLKGSSLGLVESIYNPAMEHVMEERGSERARGSHEEGGDPVADE